MEGMEGECSSSKGKKPTGALPKGKVQAVALNSKNQKCSAKPLDDFSFLKIKTYSLYEFLGEKDVVSVGSTKWQDDENAGVNEVVKVKWPVEIDVITKADIKRCEEQRDLLKWSDVDAKIIAQSDDFDVIKEALQNLLQYGAAQPDKASRKVRAKQSKGSESSQASSRTSDSASENDNTVVLQAEQATASSKKEEVRKEKKLASVSERNRKEKKRHNDLQILGAVANEKRGASSDSHSSEEEEPPRHPLRSNKTSRPKAVVPIKRKVRKVKEKKVSSPTSSEETDDEDDTKGKTTHELREIIADLQENLKNVKASWKAERKRFLDRIEALESFAALVALTKQLIEENKRERIKVEISSKLLRSKSSDRSKIKMSKDTKHEDVVHNGSQDSNLPGTGSLKRTSTPMPPSKVVAEKRAAVNDLRLVSNDKGAIDTTGDKEDQGSLDIISHHSQDMNDSCPAAIESAPISPAAKESEPVSRSASCNDDNENSADIDQKFMDCPIKDGRVILGPNVSADHQRFQLIRFSRTTPGTLLGDVFETVLTREQMAKLTVTGKKCNLVNAAQRRAAETNKLEPGTSGAAGVQTAVIKDGVDPAIKSAIYEFVRKQYPMDKSLDDPRLNQLLRNKLKNVRREMMDIKRAETVNLEVPKE